MGSIIVWFEIYVQDMERAKAFYEAVLAVKLEKMPAPTVEMNMEMWSFPSNKDTAKPPALVAHWFILLVKTAL